MGPEQTNNIKRPEIVIQETLDELSGSNRLPVPSVTFARIITNNTVYKDGFLSISLLVVRLLVTSGLC